MRMMKTKKFKFKLQEERFHSYVKPKQKAYLTPACEEITGVRQVIFIKARIDKKLIGFFFKFMVTQAPYFTEVVQQFDAWIQRHGGAILPVVDG